jgi:cholesterol oxidase
MHPVGSAWDRLKSELHTANAMDGLGVRGVSPDTRRSLTDELVDVALRVLPLPSEEHCGQAICRWINAIYGCTHRHAQLNDATHRALNEMFGFGNIDSLEHLALMMRKGLAVTHTGRLDYFDHPENIANTRVLLLQGVKNYIFRPHGTLRTLQWLRSMNPKGDYQREVLPGYAHLDAIVGTRAAVDVYPRIARFLDRTLRGKAVAPGDGLSRRAMGQPEAALSPGAVLRPGSVPRPGAVPRPEAVLRPAARAGS